MGRTKGDIFQKIFENISAAVAVVESDTIISMANDAYCELSGYSKDEVIGSCWVNLIAPEDVERLKEYNRRRLIDPTDAPTKYEFAFIRKGGEKRYGLMSVSTIVLEKRTIVSFSDITERKQAEEARRISEERYRVLIEYANDVVYAITPDGIFTYSSNNWTEKLGHSLDEVIGFSFTKFIHPDDIPKLFKLIANDFKSGERISGVEYRIQHKNGSWRWYLSSSSPVLNKEGKVISLIGIGHDITERKNAEVALKQNEALLNTLIQTIPDLIWLKDVNGVYLSCNIMFERACGISKDKIIGHTDHELINYEQADFFRKNDLIAIEKGKPHQYEEWVNFAESGQKMILDVIKTPMINPDGSLIGVLGIARDITRRKQMEEALAESEFLFKESQRAAFIGSYKADFINKRWNTSEVLDQIMGFDNDYDRSVDGWLSFVHPDDRETMEHYLKEEVLENRKPFNMEYRIVRKSDGETRWVNGLGEIGLGEDGEVATLIGTVQDITDRKHAENTILGNRVQLAIAFELAHLGAWEYDAVSDLFIFNDSFYSILRTNAAEMGGYTMSPANYVDRFVYPDDKESVIKEISALFEVESPERSRQLEHRIIYADGEIGYIAVCFSIIKDRKGRIIKTHGINQDITRRKKIEEEVKANEAKLQELNATKDKFFSIIAHDLRNPFSLIVGLSELMASESYTLTPEELRQNAQTLYKTAGLTFNLLENLLEWSRLQQGLMSLKTETLPIRKFIENVNESASEIAMKKSISINIELDEKIELQADPNMLHSVFRNLVTNAIKFTHQGGEITISAKEGQNNNVLFMIKDTGIGMPPEILDNLFRIDVNICRQGTDEEPSSGLGLILCKEFIEKHNGKIWAESEAGKGSTFWFSIPQTQSGSV